MTPTTKAGQALLDIWDKQHPGLEHQTESWAADLWADRNDLEGAILAIEAEARQPSLDALRELVAAWDELGPSDQSAQRHTDALDAARAILDGDDAPDEFSREAQRIAEAEDATWD